LVFRVALNYQVVIGVGTTRGTGVDKDVLAINHLFIDHRVVGAYSMVTCFIGYSIGCTDGTSLLSGISIRWVGNIYDLLNHCKVASS